VACIARSPAARGPARRPARSCSTVRKRHRRRRSERARLRLRLRPVRAGLVRSTCRATPRAQQEWPKCTLWSIASGWLRAQPCIKACPRVACSSATRQSLLRDGASTRRSLSGSGSRRRRLRSARRGRNQRDHRTCPRRSPQNGTACPRIPPSRQTSASAKRHILHPIGFFGPGRGHSVGAIGHFMAVGPRSPAPGEGRVRHERGSRRPDPASSPPPAIARTSRGRRDRPSQALLARDPLDGLALSSTICLLTGLPIWSPVFGWNGGALRRASPSAAGSRLERIAFAISSCVTKPGLFPKKKTLGGEKRGGGAGRGIGEAWNPGGGGPRTEVQLIETSSSRRPPEHNDVGKYNGAEALLLDGDAAMALRAAHRDPASGGRQFGWRLRQVCLPLHDIGVYFLVVFHRRAHLPGAAADR